MKAREFRLGDAVMHVEKGRNYHGIVTEIDMLDNTECQPLWLSHLTLIDLGFKATSTGYNMYEKDNIKLSMINNNYYDDWFLEIDENPDFYIKIIIRYVHELQFIYKLVYHTPLEILL